MFCNNCGKEISQNSKFCNFCGSEITTPKSKKSVKVGEKPAVKEEEFVWTCDYCGEEFNTKAESDKHEKICQSNPENAKIFCPSCDAPNFREAAFCKKCGAKLSSGNNKNNSEQSTLDEKDERYKKIKNAGTSGEALGWFNLIIGPILVFANSTEMESGYFVIDLIYFIAISVIFIKFSKNLKNVKTASLKDIAVLLWTSAVIILINLLSGKFVGYLFIIEIYYLFKAKGVLKGLRPNQTALAI